MRVTEKKGEVFILYVMRGRASRVFLSIIAHRMRTLSRTKVCRSCSGLCYAQTIRLRTIE